MKQLLKKVKQISMLLLAISLLGCENNDDDNYPEVIAGFTYTVNVDTGTVTFLNTSVNSKNYFWTFEDESENKTSSTEINPIKTFARGVYKVTLKATNVAGASDIFEDTIVISDVGAPIITLLGDTTMNIMVGGTFTDPGYTAMDDVDGDLTANIVVGGDTVDVNTAGTYVITYNVSDAAGNAATERTRTVIVAADIVKPVITLLGEPTINLMVGQTYIDEGAMAEDIVDGDITDNIVVVGVDAVDVNTAGTYTITYNVSDAAGNAADEVIRTVIVEAAPSAGDYIYATSEAVTIPSLIDNWGSGTTIVSDYSGDATYNPSIQLTSGTAWGDVSALAFTEMEAGILSNYSTLEFKIKTTDYTTIRVKVPENEITFNIADGIPLADGWVQMSLPLSNWSNEVAGANQFGILEFGAGTILITDVMLSGDGGGVVPSDCPAPPAGDLVSDGDFESGTDNCWVLFQNGGTAVFDNTISNGGTWSGKLATNGPSNPAFKQERIGVGAVMAGDVVQITFDHIGSVVQPGAVFNLLLFGEGAAGASFTHVFNPAPTLTGSWTTFTGTFSIPAGTDVTGGISFLIEAVCGGDAGCSVSANIDNVSIKLNP